MKIWMLDQYAVPPIYYPIERPHKLCKNLVKMGHDVSIFAASSVHNSDKNLIEDGALYKEDFYDDVKYRYIKTRQYKGNGKDRVINILQYTKRLKKVCDKYEKPDVIIANSFHPLTCYIGIKLAKRYGIKCVSYIADLWPLTLLELGKVTEKNIIYKALYALEKWIYTKSDAIVFTMEGGKQYIIDQGWHKENGGPVDLSKVHHINNGVDIEEFDYNKEHYTFADDDLDDENSFKVVYTGSIGRANNIDELVKVAEVVKRKDERIKFLIYGNGTEKDRLEKYCIDNSINNIVFKGRVEKKYVPYILSKSDLNIILISNKNLVKNGLSLNKSFEYLASGKPVIVNNIVGYDYIESNCAGFLMKDSDVKNYVEVIERIIKMDNKLYDCICKEARKTAYKYDYKILTSKLINVLEVVNATK